MAACPYCSIDPGGFFTASKAYCSSSENPGIANSSYKKYTMDGVDWDRCVNGKKVNGITFRGCPFYKGRSSKSKK
ncbi:MAG: hypothetical protein IKP88_14580 [Lachnospiraceae bacterium]|nr:hypothetical protein [Lachnospiraceae bacterium]